MQDVVDAKPLSGPDQIQPATTYTITEREGFVKLRFGKASVERPHSVRDSLE